ncbi:signal peptidase II [Loigolactobacillus bifermentans]|jgi:signal peptidase II|uniref:Lipoprotein signal peptidase n=1 Tax=Loigolactobacillus bifermentans DSM 20003 TaxID=1423726 RepID=A0A0R1GJS7_9LACO|nr:signal peptidase II [Loigolactobacillus bifermentans]KRK34301.1 Signal peptidase II (lipoprotein signal peptidase) (prolipoprotein signal peptidase) [Loigolactobacillus bifermentans DSM 20003]QGG59409.1 signal peptidase II [Loigolactobacillus bifermentans]
MLIYWIIALAIVIIDQLVKHWVTIAVALDQAQIVVPGVLSLANIHNDGAAWSTLAGQQWLLSSISAIAVIVIGYLLVKRPKNAPIQGWGLAFMLAGAAGNLIDRLRLGYVVDMFQLEFVNFPIFNVADSALTIGVLLIFIQLLREETAHK